MAYQEKEYKRRLISAQGNSALFTLVAINLIFFVILFFFKAVNYMRIEDSARALTMFNENVLSWFTLPADIDKLASRPWTIFSHMFVDVSAWNVLANMLWLWCFGYIMQDLTGNRKIIPVYLYGSFGGALAFVLAYNFIPGLQAQLPVAFTMGASTGVMAIAVATTMVAPDYRIFPMLRGGIPLWVLTAIYSAIAILDIRTDPGGHVPILAGALVGFLFMIFFRRGYDWSEWMNNVWDWFDNLFNPDRRQAPNFKEELFYKANTRPYKKTPNVTEQRIDEILDKISQRGYNSLTEDEKDLLKRASQDL